MARPTSVRGLREGLEINLKLAVWTKPQDSECTLGR